MTKQQKRAMRRIELKRDGLKRRIEARRMRESERARSSLDLLNFDAIWDHMEKIWDQTDQAFEDALDGFNNLTVVYRKKEAVKDVPISTPVELPMVIVLPKEKWWQKVLRWLKSLR
jgi:hypothetical protein